MTTRLRVVAGCVGTGLLLCASMPPWGWWPLALVGVVALDRLTAGSRSSDDVGAGEAGGSGASGVVGLRWQERFRRGVLIGLALYVPGLSWMGALTVPGYLVACVLYAAMLGLAVAALPRSGDGRYLALAGTWTLAELLRWSWPFGGVPLASLAHGQVAGPLAGVARVGGALLLVTVTVALGAALAAAVARRWRVAGALAAVVLVAVVLAAVAPEGRDVSSIEVALVQGGGEQGTRKEDTGVEVPFERHVRATAGVAHPVDLVVWPEDVIDTEGPFVDDPWSAVVARLARQAGAPMVVGTVEGDGPDRFRNAAVLVSSAGEVVDRYDKVHRVPFGEYVPFRGLLEAVAEDALPDRDLRVSDGPARLDVGGDVGRVAVVISWEVFFADRVREGVEDGGRLVLNPTNGSSFTGTIVQTQQVASSRLRAIETGRWVLQVAPTGFTAVVAADGDVLERSAVSEVRVIQRQVTLREGLTWFTRVGNAPAVLLSLLLVAGGWALARLRRV